MWQKILKWLLERATLKIYTSNEPIGVRLGGFDIQGVPDKYIILQVELKGIIAFTGYWQTA